MDDFKQHFSVASGKTMWVLTDEWMLPLGDKLKEYIQDVLDAKDKYGHLRDTWTPPSPTGLSSRSTV